MRQLASRIKRHPGLPVFAAIVFAGIVAGATHGSVQRAVIGAVLMLVVFGPVFFSTLPEDDA